MGAEGETGGGRERQGACDEHDGCNLRGTGQLRVTAVLEIPKKEEDGGDGGHEGGVGMERGLPTGRFPSDHLLMAARFLLRR